MGADDVDVAGDDETEYLLARPERSGLQDGRLGHFAVPRGEEHQQVHHLALQVEIGPKNYFLFTCVKDHAIRT